MRESIEEGRTSFLKKRSKKLLIIVAAVSLDRAFATLPGAGRRGYANAAGHGG
jgi:hypothetical protein